MTKLFSEASQPLALANEYPPEERGLLFYISFNIVALNRVPPGTFRFSFFFSFFLSVI